MLQDASLRLNASYYITKQILPPLDRVFALIGVDVRKWYGTKSLTICLNLYLIECSV